MESVVAAAAYELGLEARLEAVSSAVIRDLISEYCVVVMAANWPRVAPLFVVAAARLLMWPSNWAM